MAKKPTITTVATGYKATDTVNDNFTNVRNAFDNTLSLDGSTPNSMGSDLDMNSHNIINVNNIYADNIIYEGALPIVNGGTGATTAAGARTNLGLGTMAVENTSTYLTVSTASSTYLTQSGAASTYLTQTNAASTYQPLDADLTTLGGLSKTDGNFIVGDGTTWVVESGATARASLGLGTMATETASNYLTTSSAASTYLTQTNAASTYQPLDADLTAISGLSNADNNFIVGNGTTWVAESGATARTSLGLGTAATSNSTDFAAASHTHTASSITDFSEAVDDRVNGLLVAGTGITLTYNDLGNTLTIAASSSGTGDVTGPASATANNFASFDGTTGKAIKDSTYSASSFAAAVHTHAISDVTNLQTTLDGKQPLDADLTAIAGLAGTDGFLKKTAADTWSLDTSTYLTTSSASSTYQPLDADLTAISALSNADNNFIVGNGTTWVAESGATVRTSLGLGTGDSPQFTSIELGNATDTTITRSSAGVISVEGKPVVMTTGGQTIEHALGAVGTPSITATSDTNTGFWFPAADTVAVSTGGSERMRIDSAGIVSVSDGLQINKTAVTSPTSSDGNVFSGSYTPTLTNVTNVDSSTAAINQYMRVGNVVTVSGVVTIDPTSSATDTELRMSLPIASALTGTRQVAGAGSCITTGRFGESLAILADSTNDAALFRLRPTSTASSIYSFVFTYVVV